MRAIKKYFLPFLLLSLALPASAATNPRQDIFTFIFPAPALRQSLQAVLPMPIEQNNASFSGRLLLNSIDQLRIHDNIISVHGIVSGKKLSMHTKIAGQNINLKLGQVTLPLACDLHLRFDNKKHQLFVTPYFTSSTKKPGNPGNVLLPLLAALGGREYPVDLSRLQSFSPTIGKKQLNIQFKPVQVTTKNNQLVLGLKPEKKKSR
ncbi:MAG TPA: hypothetical protein ENK84_11835 [Desulfobulbus sp.]|nr:hypothetical protein [Desulfobulbus sp.]